MVRRRACAVSNHEAILRDAAKWPLLRMRSSFLLARFVLSRVRSLGIAALSLIAPLMFYTDLELSENLAYPLALVAIWAMLRALREPSPRNGNQLSRGRCPRRNCSVAKRTICSWTELSSR